MISSGMMRVLGFGAVVPRPPADQNRSNWIQIGRIWGFSTDSFQSFSKFSCIQIKKGMSVQMVCSPSSRQ